MRWHSKQQAVVFAHLADTEEQLSELESRLQALQEEDRSMEEIEACESDINILEEKRKTAVDFDQQACERMDDAFVNFYNIQGPANLMLKQVLIDCNLMSGEETFSDFEVATFDAEARESDGCDDRSKSEEDHTIETETFSESLSKDNIALDGNQIEQLSPLNLEPFTSLVSPVAGLSPKATSIAEDDEDGIEIRYTSVD